MRYDQFMRLGWKVLVPVSLVWVLMVAAIKTAPGAHEQPRALITTLIIVGIVGVLLSFLWPAKVQEEPAGRGRLALGGIDTTGTFPIPRLEDLLAERAPSPVAVGALTADPRRHPRSRGGRHHGRRRPRRLRRRQLRPEGTDRA